VADGETRFRGHFPDYAAKIDGDSLIDDPLRTDFWRVVDRTTAIDANAISDHADRCCRARQFRGPDVVLVTDELVATAQNIGGLANDLSRQRDPSSSVPPLTRREAEVRITEISIEPDEAEALRRFRGTYKNRRLRVSKRVFAFQNPDNAGNPIDYTPRSELFDRLALPGSPPADDYIFIEFQPHDRARKKRPNCLDAGMWNLGVFVPGGHTAPIGLDGLPELITPPPLQSAVTSAPRRAG